MRSTRPEPPASHGSPDRLVRRTGRGLALTTLLLIVALLGGVGIATAAVAIRQTDASVDRSLRDAATAAIGYLELIDVDAPPTAAPSPGQSLSPLPTDEAEPSESADDGSTDQPEATDRPRTTSNPTDQPGDTNDDDANEPPDGFTVPAPVAGGQIVLALAPLPHPSRAPTLDDFEADADDQPPADSDTFFLVLDAQGNLLSNPRRVLLAGLPDKTAVTAAAANGEDWRTVYADGAPVRLFTQKVTDGRGGPPAFLQTGMVLSLQEVQRNEILMTILLASLLGLLGAGLVTLVVTRRALTPVRNAFAAERRFVAAASHELRTPVAVLHSLAEVLQREDLIKPEGQQIVDDMISETDQLGRLVGDLLALSAAEAGAVVVEPRQLEARSFVTELGRRIESVAEPRGLSLKIDQVGAEAAPQLFIYTDADRLAQLLLIFADNAIDHSPAGGRLTMTVEGVADHGQRRIRISIADQGPGVPVGERKRIFEPFARLESRDRGAKSTGLGLAIARTLADRLGARLEVGDAIGGGAIFGVELARQESVVGDPRIEPVTESR
jgi:signal transduction histidine kinase